MTAGPLGGAEVRGVGRARLRGREPHGHTGLDADADLAERALQDVRAVARRVHPAALDLVRGREPARAPGDVLADRPGAGAARVAVRRMRSSIVAPAGVVWSKKRAATMCAVWRAAARRRRGFSLSRGRPWRARSALCRHSTAARTTCDVRAGRRDVDVRAALRLGGGGHEQRDEREQGREERHPAKKGGAEQGDGLPVLGASGRWFVRPEAPERSFGNPAGSWRSSVALRPVLADGLPFREANLSFIGSARAILRLWTIGVRPARHCASRTAAAAARR